MRDRVADGARSVRVAEAVGEFIVRGDCAGRNPQQCLPYFDLEVSTGHEQVQRRSRFAVEPRKNPGRNRAGDIRSLDASRSRPRAFQFAHCFAPVIHEL